LGTFIAEDMNGLVQTYRSPQFHFHTSSEHEIDAKNYDLELHIVFFADPRRDDLTTEWIGVTGFLFKEDANALDSPYSAFTREFEKLIDAYKTVRSII
jgi:carbonic anhydrase